MGRTTPHSRQTQLPDWGSSIGVRIIAHVNGLIGSGRTVRPTLHSTVEYVCRLLRLQDSRHTVGTMLAEMGEHHLVIRDYLRHANLHVTDKYLQATTTSKRSAQGRLVDAILLGGVLSASKSTLIH